jgi:hypothetical protein
VDTWDKREMASEYSGNLDAFVADARELSKDIGDLVADIRKEHTRGFTLRGQMDSVLVDLLDVEKARKALEDALAEAMQSAYYLAEGFDDRATEEESRETAAMTREFYKDKGVR